MKTPPHLHRQLLCVSVHLIHLILTLLISLLCPWFKKINMCSCVSNFSHTTTQLYSRLPKMSLKLS